MYDAYLLIPAFIVVVLIEHRGQQLSKNLAAAEDPASGMRAGLFRYNLVLWFALVTLLILGSLAQNVLWNFWNQLSKTICDTTTSHRLIGLYGCYRVLDVFRALTTPWILVPALAGLTAGLLLFWPGRQAVSLRGWILTGVLLSGVVLFMVFQTTREMLMLVGLPILSILLAWYLPQRGRWGRMISLLGLLFLAVVAWFYFYQPDIYNNPANGVYSLFFSIGVMMLIPLISGVVAAKALIAALRPDRLLPLRRVIVLVLIAAALLALTIYLLILETLWDSATDGMSQIFIIMLCLYGGIAGAMLAAWTLPGWRKLGPLVFSIALVLLMVLTRDQWSFTDRIAVTDSWGARIAQAVERYQARSGRYPAALTDLVPFDIWRIQRPFVYRDQDWCYQAGQDYYRLAYVHRPAFGVPPQYITIRMVGSAGKPPAGAWSCDAALEHKQKGAPGMPAGY